MRKLSWIAWAGAALAGALLTWAWGQARPPGVAGPAPALPGESPGELARFVFPADAAVNGIRISELSGLAWDADEQLLYAVSDQGKVFHFRLRHAGSRVVALEPVHAAALVDPQRFWPMLVGFNAEGCAVRNADNGRSGDTELVVAIEARTPRILRFDPQGKALGDLPVPPPAHDRHNYRKKRWGLESVLLHPGHGLMTAPEAPLLGQPAELHTLYAEGGHWSFARRGGDSWLKALDVLPGGDVVALERNSVAGGLQASLRRVHLAGCQLGATCASATRVLLPPGPHNFEGMTPLDDQHLLLVSDNGNKGALDTVFVLLALPGTTP